jgi:hypothetical protein
MKQKHFKNKVSDETIKEVFNRIPHIGKIAAELNLPSITVWRRLKKLELQPCGKGGSKLKIQEILEGKHPHYSTSKLSVRLKKEGILKNKCAVCGITEWNKRSIVMELDHINGISSDHRLENLRMICPNCHSQTDTYCGKNKIG